MNPSPSPLPGASPKQGALSSASQSTSTALHNIKFTEKELCDEQPMEHDDGVYPELRVTPPIPDPVDQRPQVAAPRCNITLNKKRPERLKFFGL
jgi:hypothetical protein